MSNKYRYVCRGCAVEDRMEERGDEHRVKTAAEDRLAIAAEKATPLRRIGKTYAGAKAGLRCIDLGEGSRGKWDRVPKPVCGPEQSGGRIALSGHSDVPEEVRRLAIVGPRQAQIHGEIVG